MSTNVPAKLIAGDTWSWLASFPDYPASAGWALTVYFQQASANFSAASVASGDDHRVTVSATDSAPKTAGRYRWRARITNGSESYTLEEGWTDVQPNPASTQNVDLRSDKRKLLDAIDATLLRKATADQQAMAINGRSLSRIPIPELEQLRARIAAEVATEERGVKAGLSRKLKSRFSRG